MILYRPRAELDFHTRAFEIQKWSGTPAAKRFTKAVNSTLRRAESNSSIRSRLDVDTGDGRPLYYTPVSGFPGVLLIYLVQGKRSLELVRILPAVSDLESHLEAD